MISDTALKRIDKAIFFLFIIFAGSLTNSIFVNQIGYFGALILLLVRYGLTKKNPFEKNGLELYFVLFLFAELLASIFSVNPPQSFHNFLKRLLLIPVVYVASTVIKNPKQFKTVIYVFIGFSLLSSFLYLWSSYSFYLRGLFQMNGSGPFLFQYPITTSELFSFTSMILFPFVIQKNISFKKRLLFATAFLITVLSLLATFKRTGWIGFAAGIVVIILLKRKYIYLAALALGILIVAFTQETISKVEVFSLKNKMAKLTEIKTNGQIYNLYNENGNVFASDYTAGLEKLNGNNLLSLAQFDSPVIEFKHWKNNYYVASLMDTRFALLKKNQDGGFIKTDVFMSKGMTKDFAICENNLFVVDIDSGLTVFNKPADIKSRSIFKEFVGYTKLTVADSVIILSNRKKKAVGFLFNNDGNKIVRKYEFFSNSGNINSINYVKSEIMLQTAKKIYVTNPALTIEKTYPNTLSNILKTIQNGNDLYAVFLGGTFAELNFADSTITSRKIYSFNYNPRSLVIVGDTLFSAHLRTSRVASIFDPYLSSNANRLAFWRAGFKMFADHPFFGVGDIDLANLYRQYKRPFDKEIQGHMHNNYVHFLVILGAFGFILVMILLFKLFMIFLINVKKYPGDNFWHSISLGFTGAYISFLVAGLTEWNFGDQEILTLIWFMLGLVIAMRKIKLKN